MINPESHRRLHRLLRACVLFAAFGVFVWAALPSRVDPALLEVPEIGGLAETEVSSEIEERTVSVNAFEAVNLWHTPPAEAPKQSTPMKASRVAFELLAISSGKDETGKQISYGVIYDPIDDQVHTLSIGQSVNGYTVSDIQNDTVVLRYGQKETKLVLESGEGG